MWLITAVGETSAGECYRFTVATDKHPAEWYESKGWLEDESRREFTTVIVELVCGPKGEPC